MATDLLSALVQRSKQVADPIATAYASGNRPFHVRVSRPSVIATFDRDTGQLTNPADQVLYEGPARIWTVTGGVEMEIGDERTMFSSARASIDSTVRDAQGNTVPVTIPRVDDLFEILPNGQSQATHLSGRAFTVTDIEVGGHYSTGYVLTLSGVAPSRRT